MTIIRDRKINPLLYFVVLSTKVVILDYKGERFTCYLNFYKSYTYKFLWRLFKICLGIETNLAK